MDEKEKNFLDGYLYALLEVCNLQNVLDYEIVDNKTILAKFTISKQYTDKFNDNIIDLSDLIELNNKIQKSNYKYTFDARLVVDFNTKSIWLVQ